MRGILDREDFVPYAPDTAEDFVVIAHQNCENGVDHKKRLWIKRNTDGSIVAKCQNCQLKGYYRATTIRHRDTLKKIKEKVEASVSKTTHLPEDTTYVIQSFPVEFRSWLYKARLNDEDISSIGMGYSAVNDRLIIPVYGRNSKLSLFIGRARKGVSPKYIVQESSTDRHIRFYERALIDTDTVVIVEDVLSAYRCAAVAGASVAILSSNVSIETLKVIMEPYSKAIVFLDNDNPTVKTNQRILAKNLALLTGKKIPIVKGTKDPKEYSDKELEDMINGVH